MKSDLSDHHSPSSYASNTKVPLVSEALKKQLKQSAGVVYHRALDQIERASSLRGFTKSNKKYNRIVEQSRVICEDYIYCRLQGLCSHFPFNGDDNTPDDDSAIDEDIGKCVDDVELNAVSLEIQHIGAKLELSYPSLYVDLPRHLAMPLRSQVGVRKALVSIGDFMFRGQPPVITWCRIVGLFAVAAAIAREVVINGNAHLIPTIVTTFAELVDCYLSTWIYKQGGWIQVVNEFRIDDRKVRRRIVTTAVGFLFGFSMTWLSLP